ncbi:MAG: endolytic transglycosylase MltG [Candidatus Parcubacteria bacterium]|nr:endolytic transglycosylase MltG [Candidatus Parcubacteria bacterium]
MNKIFAIVIVIVIVIVLTAGWVFKIVFIAQSGTGISKAFVIKTGSGVNQISRDLKKEGLIDSSSVFETYVWLKKAEGKILAGEHEIKDTWSLRQLTNALTSGNTLDNELNIKIIEGWDLYDLAEYFEKIGLAKKETFYALSGQPGKHDNTEMPAWVKDYEFLKEKPEGVSLEGYLFPDTYRVFKNSNLKDIITKMLDNFDKKVNSKILGDIIGQNKKLYDILTLASIVEKEAQTPEDKKKVAGVYYNRLKIGMALQADPTVNYITGKQTDRPSLDDLKVENLYNTYKYPGLPPGPICNPGMDSILATVYPDNNDYFYFINTPEGKLVFARTLEEHAANRAKYFKDN